MFEEREVLGRVLLKRVLEERDVAEGARDVLFLFALALVLVALALFVARVNVARARAPTVE